LRRRRGEKNQKGRLLTSIEKRGRFGRNLVQKNPPPPQKTPPESRGKELECWVGPILPYRRTKKKRGSK